MRSYCLKPLQEVFPLWEELKARPPHFMEKYIEQYRQWKATMNTDLEHKFDTMGRSLADIQRERQKQIDLFNNMNRWASLNCWSVNRSCSCVLVTVISVVREIEETVAVLGHPGVAGASFFVAHFNYLCKYVLYCIAAEDYFSTGTLSRLF